jgi:hypothetical protein
MAPSDEYVAVSAPKLFLLIKETNMYTNTYNKTKYFPSVIK